MYKLNHQQIFYYNNQSYLQMRPSISFYLLHYNHNNKPDLVEEGQKDILEEILLKYKEIIYK